MKGNFLKSKSKKEDLIKDLTDQLRLSRSSFDVDLNLAIVTCYVTIDSIESFVKDIKTEINSLNLELISIRVFCDRTEALKISEKEYNDLKNQGIELLFVESKLFHPKAYCLYDKNNNGCLCTSSANLTKAGLTNQSGNIEMFLNTYEKDVIQNFLDDLDDLKRLRILSYDKCKSFKFEEEDGVDNINFMYALLNCGKFMYNWEVNLEQELRIIYNLTDLGKEAIRSPEFTQRSFKELAKTISKNYFKEESDKIKNFIENQQDSNEEENFQALVNKNYGIETHFGYWIPKPVSEAIENRDRAKFNQFKAYIKDLLLGRKLQEKTDSTIVQKMYDDDVKWLIGENKDQQPYIKTIKGISIKDFLGLNEEKRKQKLYEVLKERVDTLLKNEIKLKRLYNKINFISFPYSTEFEDEIKEVYEHLLETIESRKNNNKAIKAVKDAVSHKSIQPFYDFNYFIESENRYIPAGTDEKQLIEIIEAYQKRKVIIDSNSHAAYKQWKYILRNHEYKFLIKHHIIF
ncbi:MAG: hypothetical protein KA714_22110 [Limnoraphis sp. WC205]|nr:hypothetical protein [Limnoraphis sp. WC205]